MPRQKLYVAAAVLLPPPGHLSAPVLVPDVPQQPGPLQRAHDDTTVQLKVARDLGRGLGVQVHEGDLQSGRKRGGGAVKRMGGGGRLGVQVHEGYLQSGACRGQ